MLQTWTFPPREPHSVSTRGPNLYQAGPGHGLLYRLTGPAAVGLGWAGSGSNALTDDT